MNRVYKYNESIHKFIKDNYDFSDLKRYISNQSISIPTHKNIMLLPIMLLTMLNDEIKYYFIDNYYHIAVIFILYDILLNVSMSDRIKYEIMFLIIRASNKSKISIENIDLFNELLKINDVKDEFIKYEKIDILKKNMFIDNDDIIDFMKKTILPKIRIVFNVSGKKIKKDHIEESALHFCMLYKIMYDFNIVDSLMNEEMTQFSKFNYVINNGFEKSYCDYLESKQKFIQIMKTIKIYSNTIDEILNIFDDIISNVIKKIEPENIDLNSICSTG